MRWRFYYDQLAWQRGYPVSDTAIHAFSGSHYAILRQGYMHFNKKIKKLLDLKNTVSKIEVERKTKYIYIYLFA